MRREPQRQDYREANGLGTTRMRIGSKALDMPRRKLAAEHAARHGQQNARLSLRYSHNLHVRIDLAPHRVAYEKHGQALAILRLHLTRKFSHEASAPAAARGGRLLTLQPLSRRSGNSTLKTIRRTYT